MSDFKKPENVRTKLMWKFATCMIEEKCTIFGGFVRDMLISEVNFSSEEYTGDFSVYPNDIDMVVDGATPFSFKSGKLEQLCQKAGFECTLLEIVESERGSYETMTYEVKPFHSDLLGLKDCSFKVDLVKSVPHLSPPFNKLDMLCNGFIWDLSGVRFSKNCGLKMDSESDISRKMKEAQTLGSMLNRETEMVVPNILQVNYEPMSPEMITLRKSLIRRICKMWKKRWNITNLKHLRQITYIRGIVPDEYQTEVCPICQQSFDNDDVAVQCNACKVLTCVSCFEEYSMAELEGRITIRCPNTCSLRDGWKLW